MESVVHVVVEYTKQVQAVEGSSGYSLLQWPQPVLFSICLLSPLDCHCLGEQPGLEFHIDVLELCLLVPAFFRSPSCL